MANLDEFYNELISGDKDKEAKKTITLRLPLPVHRKLDVIREVGSTSKTVAAEEIIINAIEDVYQRLVHDPRLEHYWIERSEQERLEAEEADLQAQYDAFASHGSFSIPLPSENGQEATA